MDIKRESKKKSISLGIAINIVAYALLRSISIVTAPIITRLLSTEDYGVMSIFNTWCGIISIIAGLSTYGSLTNFRVKTENIDSYNKYCWNSLLLSILGHTSVFILMFLTKNFWANLFDLPSNLVPIIVISSLFQYCISFTSSYLIIENKAFCNFVLSFASTVFSFVLSILFIYKSGFFKGQLYFAFIIGHLITNALVGVICIFYFYVKGKSRLNRKYIYYCLKISVPLIFHSLASTVLGSSDRIMLQKMVNLSVAGIYSFTYNFASILAALWSAINAIWTPFFFEFLKRKDLVKLKEKKRNFDFLFLVLAIGFIWVYPEIFRVLASAKYWSQMDIIPIIVIAFIWMHFYSFPANYETYSEKTKYVAIGTIGSAIINIVLNFILIPVWLEWGAAIATMLSYTALYIFHTIIAKKIIKQYPLKIAKDLMGVISILFIIFLSYIFSDAWYVRWGMAVITGSILICQIIKRKEII